MTALLVILALVVGPPLAQKKREWMEGKILEVNFRRDMEGPNIERATGAGTSGALNYKDFFTYVVQAGDTRYTLEEQATKQRFGEGQTIKFAVEKKNWFIIDEKGKEKKGNLKGTIKITP